MYPGPASTKLELKPNIELVAFTGRSLYDGVFSVPVGVETPNPIADAWWVVCPFPFLPHDHGELTIFEA
jgi:hypothetical protein